MYSLSDKLKRQQPQKFQTLISEIPPESVVYCRYTLFETAQTKLIYLPAYEQFYAVSHGYSLQKRRIITIQWHSLTIMMKDPLLTSGLCKENITESKFMVTLSLGSSTNQLTAMAQSS